MKRWILAVFLMATAAFAQQQSSLSPIPDCSLGYCSGLGVPTFACNAAQRYAQIDNPGTNYTCSGMPPHWVKDAGAGGTVTLPTGIVYGQGTSSARPSTFQDVVNLWGACPTGQFLQAGGTCSAGTGGTANLPQGIPYAASAGTVATTATATNVVSPFHSTTITPNYYLKTTFNEGSVGSNFLGTHPATCQNGCTGVWSADESAVSAVFSAGGVTFTGYGTENAGGAAITLGHTDYTMRVSITSLGSNQRASIAIRRTDSNNAVVIAFNGVTSANIYDLVGGTLSASLAFGNFNLQNLVIVTAGNNITVGDGSSTPPLSVNVSDNLTGATMALTQDGGGTGATFASLSVQGPSATTQVACAGFANADGTCSAASSNTVAAADANGHLAGLPNIGTATDPNTGAVSIAWQEDPANGKFDCRDTKYDGGCLGSTPGLALQDMANDMICYEAFTGKHPQTEFPNATMLVGTPTQPTLIFPTGGYYHGSLSRNGSGTTFQATYNNVRALQFNSGQSAVCSDGHSHTAGVTAGRYVGFGENGCSQGVCTNVPGDTGTYPNGGPNQEGIYVGDSNGTVELLAANGNGGSGLTIGGQDTITNNVWAFNNNFWFYFGKNQSGQTYNPSTDGNHCDVCITGVDNQTDGVETYGTNNTVGNEYGHIFGVYWGDGNGSLSHVFAQVNEICLRRQTGNDRGTLSVFRCDAPRGEGIYIDSNSNTLQGIKIISACRDSGVAAMLGGHCDYIDDHGTSNIWQGVQINNDGYFGTDYSTGNIWPAGSSYWSGIAGTFQNVYGQAGAFNAIELPQGNEQLGGHEVTGATPDVTSMSHIWWGDTSAVNVTGVQNALIMQDLWISTTASLPVGPGGSSVVVPNTNVTLISTVNGGAWQTCDGQNINFTRAAVLHFVVEDMVASQRYVQQCDKAPQNFAQQGTVPPTSTTTCSDGDYKLGAHSGTGGIYECHPANTWTFYPFGTPVTSF